MKSQIKTLEETCLELAFDSPDRFSHFSHIAYYHYTSDKVKKLIIDENHNINFKLSKASDFLDKNEGTYILEPYYHACGCLYESGRINSNFFEFLIDVGKSDIIRSNNDVWILCLSAEGYSRFMKERYAPGDGWQIILQPMSFEELIMGYSSGENSKNHLYMAKVDYDYENMKNQIEKAILKLYYSYNQDSELTSEKKNNFLEKSIVGYLSRYSFRYKSKSYEKEKEIRLICSIEEPFDKWVNPNDSEMSLYFKENEHKEKNLYLKFGPSCYCHSTQVMNKYNSAELNKPILSSEEIRAVARKHTGEE